MHMLMCVHVCASLFRFVYIICLNTGTPFLQLIVGVYTFKVAVSAEGKYGEALVNVTVNDGMYD